MSDPYIGQIMMAGFNFAPNGWAKCDGSLLNISSFTALFSLLGTQYGGNGQTTFALPDMRGRFPMHHGNGPGLPPRTIGTKAGEFEKQLTLTELPAHTHEVRVECNSEEGNADDPSQKFPAVLNENQYSNAKNDVMAPSKVLPAGSGQAFDIVNPFLAVNFIIALQGIFPSPN